MADRDQTELLSSAISGDEIAFRRIISEHHEDMRRVCLAISGDHAIADEATQAAWLVAWKKIANVHGPSQLRPWLVSVAANEAKKLMHKRQRRAEIEVASDMSGEPGGIDPLLAFRRSTSLPRWGDSNQTTEPSWRCATSPGLTPRSSARRSARSPPPPANA